jgi:hypothetical protein
MGKEGKDNINIEVGKSVESSIHIFLMKFSKIDFTRQIEILAMDIQLACQLNFIQKNEIK